VPSRTIKNCKRPLSVRLYNQPRTVTSWPSYWPISRICIRVATQHILIVV